jgi:divalent metal cation (Fe/Co/Zn/Cd) transporter
MTDTVAPMFWALVVAQVSVGVLEGSYAVMALGVSQGAGLALIGSDDREHSSELMSRGLTVLVGLLLGSAALLTIVYAAQALVSGGSSPGHPISLWLVAGSTVLALAWWRTIDLAGGGQALGGADAASVTMQTIFALGAVIGGEYGWDWADPLGGLLLANVPLRTAWKAAVEAFGGVHGPEAAGSVNKRHKSA